MGALKVSQSLMKDVRDYLEQKQCGNVLKSKWIDDTYPEDYDSDSMALGSFFEFALTEMILGPGKGTLPKSGQIPHPEYYKKSFDDFLKASKSGTPFNLDEEIEIEDDDWGKVMVRKHYMKPYRLAILNAKRVKKYLDDMGIEVISAGERHTKGKHEGTIDLRCYWNSVWESKDKPGSFVRNKKEIIIDLKYSGLLEDKWSRHGWMWTDDQRKYHGTQAKEYHHLTGLPFYFMVVSSTNLTGIKFFHVLIDEFTLDQHLLEAKDTLDKMKLFAEIGFSPYPEISRCSGCPIREKCKDKATVPLAEEVDLRIQD